MSKMITMTLAFGLIAACGGGGSDDGPDAADPPDASPDAPPGVTTAITYTVTKGGLVEPELGDVVMVRDGDGAWQRMAGGAGGVYSASVVGPRYTIARACRDEVILYYEVWIFHLTLDDTTALRDIGCQSASNPILLSGAVTGIPAGQRGYLWTTSGIGFLSATSPSYEVGLAAGTTDLVASLFTTGQPRPTLRYLIERDVPITSKATFDLDFAANGFDPVEHVITVPGVGGGEVERIGASLTTPNGVYRLESYALADDRVHLPPDPLLRPGDLVTVSRQTGMNAGPLRSVAITTSTIGDVSGTLPAEYPSPPAALVTHPGGGLALTGTLPFVADADWYAAWALQSDQNTLATTYWIHAYSQRYAGGQAIDFTFPDFSSEPAWNVALDPVLEISWTEEVITNTLYDEQPPGFPGAGHQTIDGNVARVSAQRGILLP